MATKPAGADQYGDSSLSSNPGKRTKTRSFDTSVGETATTVAANATVNTVAAAQDAIVKASRVVAARRMGLARTVESLLNSAADSVRIILVGGQSNASRWMRQSVAADFATWPDYITATPGTLAAPSPEYFNGTTIEDWDTNESGQAGMGHYWLTGLAGTGAAFGFQDAAAHYLKRADPNTRYIFVEVSQPGSILGLENIPVGGSWNTDYAEVKAQRANGALLEALELRFNALVAALNAAGVNYVVDSMLYHQGETDGNSENRADAYQTNLTALIARVRSFTGTANLPFLFGTVSTRSSQFNAFGATVRTAMKAVRDAVANTYLRDMEDWAGRPSEGDGVGSGAGGADSTASHFGGHTADKFGLWVAKKRGQVPVLPAWNVQHSYSGDRAELLAAFRAQCTEGFDPSLIDIRALDNQNNAILATLGAQTHPNGKVYFAPDGNSDKIYAFNPETDEIEVAATTAAQQINRSGIALAPNGLLVMAPGDGGATRGNWLVFNPTGATIAGVAAGATQTVATALVSNYGTILGSDGFIYAVPRTAGATIRRLDPTNLTESNFGATAPAGGNGLQAGGTLSILDGRIYSANQGAGRVLIIDTVAGTTSGALATAVEGLGMTNGPDGNLYYGSFAVGGEIIKVTPGGSPAIGNFGSTLAGRRALTQIGPDGRLYCPPWSDDDRVLSSFDVQSGLVLNQADTFEVGVPGRNFAAGALTTDGRMIVANKATGGNRRMVIIGEKRPGALSIDFVCSPYATNW